MICYLAIIQARLYSTRFPNKVMQLVKGRTMLKRVWDAAKDSWADKVVVAWPERFPDLDESNVLGRFDILIHEFDPMYVIRLTADCPLLEAHHINDAIRQFEINKRKPPFSQYYNNGLDGYDVQIFTPEFMYLHPHREHVLNVPHNTGGVSVNTPQELEMVKLLAK